MKPRIFIWFFLVAAVLSACRDRMGGSGDAPELTLTLEFPAVPATKANEGEVAAATVAECTIYNLGIWIFRENDDHTHTLIAGDVFDRSQPDHLPKTGSGSSVVQRYVFPVSRELAIERPDVDVFVLANSGSIGCGSFTKETSYETLIGATFGDEDTTFQQFSPGAPVTAVPEGGLPMSGFASGLKMGGEDYSLSVGQLTLKRAVSKLRYVFCQMLTEGEDAETMKVTKVELDTKMIPKREYVFVTRETPTGANIVRSGVDDYVNKTMVTPNSAAIPKSDKPELYLYGSGTAGPASYEAMITQAIIDNKLANPGGTYYLRESDKQLSGKVYYTVNGVARDPVPFNMAVPGDFVRNRTWTMYGMFVTNRTLLLSLSVQPWDMNEYVIDFRKSAASVTIPLTVVPSSVASISEADDDDNIFVTLHSDGRPAQAYFNIVTPSGWEIVATAEGDTDVTKWFEINLTPSTVTPNLNHGQVVVSVAYIKGFPSSLVGKSITLSFKVLSPDLENPEEISLASEDSQHYHFVLPHAS